MGTARLRQLCCSHSARGCHSLCLGMELSSCLGLSQALLVLWGPWTGGFGPPLRALCRWCCLSLYMQLFPCGMELREVFGAQDSLSARCSHAAQGSHGARCLGLSWHPVLSWCSGCALDWWLLGQTQTQPRPLLVLIYLPKLYYVA